MNTVPIPKCFVHQIVEHCAFFGMYALKTLVETWSTLVDTIICLDIVCSYRLVCAVAYPGWFCGCPETPPPPGHDFFNQAVTPLLAPTFTSHLNLPLLEKNLETNSGYATGVCACVYCTYIRAIGMDIQHNHIP